ncbi:hypothetical protein NAP1_01065 [Erythrobacter sp. NAP1]|uniref:hypothetical protein n=1 Tax=Erythrobacter sp. NAP1 TaxID=237727 RepID=UPI0000686EBA|nr:hypothetical protein [Erythrobacter sp. NAP1]EAQ29319.1 hypothetical protein NAP1_01065 [Erythrobacter sp. NAP1]
MITVILLAAAQPEIPAQSAEPDCSYDLEAMLELDRQAFDQDIPDGGWRGLSREGCHEAAAELIRTWRHQKRDHNSILYWHEGQMRAYAGQTKEAIALFELTRKSQDFDADFGWNHYVDGTVAFLRQDREGLERAKERLATIPEPSNNSFTRPDGTVVQMSWPPNMNVLNRFEYCWGKTYKEAYGGEECTPPADEAD